LGPDHDQIGGDVGAVEPAQVMDARGEDRLLERADEIAVIDAALHAARRGNGSAVLIEGAAGIGKSRLLRFAREPSDTGEANVLSVRGLELESGFPFELAVRLLEPVLRGLDASAHARAFAGTAAGARRLFEAEPIALGDGTAQSAQVLIRGLRQLTINLLGCAVLGESPSLVLLVDDAQWSDVASLRFLAHLTAGVHELAIALLVAARPGEGEAAVVLNRGLASAPEATVLRLRPLSDGGVEHIVRATYPDAAAAFLRACTRATGGNPFYLHELLAVASADGIAGDSRGAQRLEGLVPQSVMDSVLLRLGRLPDAAIALAEAVTVLGDGASLRDACLLAELDPRAGEDAADLLAANHILRPGEPLAFAHSLIGAAVYGDLPSLARARAHRRAAEVLCAGSAPVESVATHLLVCRPEADAHAVAVLRAAAERARLRGDAHVAQRLLDRALAEPPPPEVATEVVVERALAHAATGSDDAVAHVREALAVVQEPERRAQALRALARLLFTRSQFAAAADAVQRALAELDPDDALAAGLVSEALAIAGAGGSRPSAGAQARLQVLLERSRSGRLPTEPGALAQVAAAMLAAGRPAAEVVHTARAALRDLPLDDGFYGVITGSAVLAAIGAGDLSSATSRISACLEHASTVGVQITVGMANHWLAVLRWHQGDLSETIAAGERSLQVAEAGWDVCTGWVVPLLACAYLEQGDLTAAAAALERAEGVDPRRPERALVSAADALVALASGESPRAARELVTIGTQMQAVGIAHLMPVSWRSAGALALFRTGDCDEAARLAEVELVHARGFGEPRTLGIALRTAGVIAGGESGADLLAESVRVLQDGPSSLELAHSLVEHGAALRRRRRSVESREPLRRGLELAQTAGAAPLAQRAAAELRAAGGRRRTPRPGSGPAALTPAQRHVAELAAGGLSTPEIAHRLHLTPKTVDWHLGHVYRKLGISSRRRLESALGLVATPD
jgi:DNA-binding CsgD family transcriptional regulator